MDKTNLVLAFLAAAIIAGLLIHFNVSLPLPSQENFMQQSVGAPLSGSGMGPYDQVSIDGGFTGWASNEPHSAAPISAGPLAASADDNKLMHLVGNRVDSACCPAAFNTDTGCVCLTEQDKNFMAHRGGNRA